MSSSLSVIVSSLILNTFTADETLLVPTSCIGLPDGEHILKLLEGDEYPLVSTRCSNEYMIIDINKDPDWKQYFSSFDQWHYQIGGPAKNDPVNYNDWFVPAPDAEPVYNHNGGWVEKQDYISGSYPTKYLVSPECDRCDIKDGYSQQYSDKTVYNMNPAAYGLFFGVRRPACDFEWDTMECKTCKWNMDGFMTGYARTYELTLEDTAQNDRNLPNIMIGVCLTEVRSAFQRATDGFFELIGYGEYNYKPSIGTQGQFCQCVQVQTPQTEYITVSQQLYDRKLAALAKAKLQTLTLLADDDGSSADNNIVYLHQTDFEIGTYRITEPGTYVIMEDISINFNAPDTDVLSDAFSPNDPDFDYWWPPTDSGSAYPGAGYKAREAYMLGYFAAITIETRDVTLDLNGFTLEMDIEYYYQQPFFAMIELMSQPFLPNQGPGFFGADPQFAENVEIKNGVIGRTSHHGIHGTKNKNVKIKNVHIHNFMTHGIQINGFEGLHLENVEIGPTTTEAYLNHNYGHLRALLPYLNKMANWDDSHKENTISFDPLLRSDKGAVYTLNDLIDIAVEKMDKVYKYVISEDFDAKKLQKLVSKDEDFANFVNPSGLPYGAVVYGVYLNYPGSGIFGWDVSDQRSKDLYIKNLDIHDLSHEGKEVIGLSKNKKRFVVNTLLAPLNLEHMFGSKRVIKDWIYHAYNKDLGDGIVVEPHYKGTINTDLYLAMFKFGMDRFDEWWLGAPYMGPGINLVEWAEGDKVGLIMSSITKGGDYWEPVCAMDGMVHPGKGLIGLKLTNIENMKVEGSLSVYNLFDNTALMETGICITPSNQATNPKVIGSEQTPYQFAYSMNQIYGISAESSDISCASNVKINVNNIQSLTGRVYGIASWYSTKWDFNTHSSIKVNDLFAGVDIYQRQFEYMSMPNHAPEACAMGVWDGKTVKVEMNLIDDLDGYYDTLTEQYCINGHYGCWGDTEAYTNVNTVSDKKLCEQSNNRKLKNIANMNVEYSGQDMGEEPLDEVAEIIKSVSVVNDDKVDKNKDQHSTKKFDDSTAVDYSNSNSNGGNGERENRNHRNHNLNVDRGFVNLTTEKSSVNGYSEYYYYALIGVVGLSVLLCGVWKYCQTHTKYDKYVAIADVYYS